MNADRIEVLKKTLIAILFFCFLLVCFTYCCSSVSVILYLRTLGLQAKASAQIYNPILIAHEKVRCVFHVVLSVKTRVSARTWLCSGCVAPTLSRFSDYLQRTFCSVAPSACSSPHFALLLAPQLKYAKRPFYYRHRCHLP